MAPDRATARQQPPLSDADIDPATVARHKETAARDTDEIAHYKEAAARAAAELVVDGMALGLGTGSTVAYLLAALGERARQLTRTRCVATSPATAAIARELGLHVGELDEIGELDLAIDGADQVDPDCWLVKGGGGAHTREKIVAAAARRFVVIVSAEKLVSALGPPVPLEILAFGAQRTLAEVGHARLRLAGERGVGTEAHMGAAEHGAGEHGTGEHRAGADDAVSSPDGNLLAWCDEPVEDPRALAERLSATPGVVEHGLFAPELVSEVLIADGDGVTRRTGGKPAA